MTILLAASREKETTALCEKESLRGATFAGAQARDHFAPDLLLETIHLRIEIDICIPKESLTVRLVHRLRANVDGAQRGLFHGVELADLTVGGATFDYDGSELRFVLPTALRAGEETEIEIGYRVESPRSGLVFSYPTEADPTLPLFVASDHETERARHWLCTVDLPSVRPTLEFAIRAEEGLTILANGLETSRTKDGGKTLSQWRLEQPCPSYLVCFAVGDFIRYDGGAVGGVPVAAFAPRAMTSPADLERTFSPTAQLLEWMPKRLGVPFAFPKYFQFIVPNIGGAMENISLVSWDDRFVLDAELEKEERHLIDVINLHELAHSWFGDMVVCRDHAHDWLKEGFATFMENVWLEETRGKDAGLFDLWMAARNYMKESDERYARPIHTRRFETSWELFDMHLYPGAAWRIHMLRKRLGDDVFWSGVRRYLTRFQFSTAETNDFRRALEEESGYSLAEFFYEWIESPGYPALKCAFRHDAERKEGVFTVTQTPRGRDQAQTFSFDFDFGWTLGGEMLTKSVRVEGRVTSLRVAMEVSPERVSFDPSHKILADVELEIAENLLASMLQKGDAWERIVAMRHLVRGGRRADLTLVRQSWSSTEHYGFRIAASEALGIAMSAAALDFLLEVAESHQEWTSCAAVFRALGKYRDRRITTVLRARLEQDMPPRATEAALEALGAQRDDADLERFARFGRATTRSGFAEWGAYRAIAALRTVAAARLLRELAETARPQVRHHVVRAIGSLAKWLEDDERETCIQLLATSLRSPLAKVRAAAAAALVEANAKGCAASLDAFAGRLCHQERVPLERQIASLRSQKSTNADLLVRLDEAERRLRLLEDALAKVDSSVLRK